MGEGKGTSKRITIGRHEQLAGETLWRQVNMVLSYVVEITVPDSLTIFFFYSKKIILVKLFRGFCSFLLICIFTSI